MRLIKIKMGVGVLLANPAKVSSLAFGSAPGGLFVDVLLPNGSLYQLKGLQSLPPSLPQQALTLAFAFDTCVFVGGKSKVFPPRGLELHLADSGAEVYVNLAGSRWAPYSWETLLASLHPRTRQRILKKLHYDINLHNYSN